jgi:hypothetical protein
MGSKIFPNSKIFTILSLVVRTAGAVPGKLVGVPTMPGGLPLTSVVCGVPVGGAAVEVLPSGQLFG